MANDQDAWGIRLTKQRIAAMQASGAWHDQIPTDSLDRAVCRHPDAPAILAFTGDDGHRTQCTYAELAAACDRIALGLYAIGIRKGDIVSFQLNNRWEFLAIVLACVRIGAVTNPLMPILRHRELTFMLRLSASKILIVPNRFRGFDFAAMAQQIAAEVPTLQHVFAIGGEGALSFEAHFLHPVWEDRLDKAAIFAVQRPDPNDVMQLMFTSGTTGEPKGVMHTANTLFANLIPLTELMGMTRDDVVFSPTPLAHQLGYLFGVLMPVMLGCKVVLQDIWQPAVAAALIAEQRVTFATGATPFLNDLVRIEGRDPAGWATLRLFVSGGAPIPPILVREARKRIGCTVLSVWGMTENLIVTSVRPDDPAEKVFDTDGAALPLYQVRVVGDDSREVPRGTSGRLLARSPAQHVGYFKRPEWYTIDPDGWFDTGDLARMDGDGYIRITGRAKDIIIRGGENIPVVEIEAMLYEHPAVSMAAIVAMPDPRLGERACAFVTLKPGESLTFQAMCDFLRGKRISPSYLPERLECLPELPTTASGKVQKFVLREWARALAS
jgi:cyclohexanecarboxylate-CoA ligase